MKFTSIKWFLLACLLLALSISNSDPQGFGFGWSASYTPLSQQAPVNTVAPVINGANLATGGSISVSSGTWVNNPTSYLYQWYSETPGIPVTSGLRLVQTLISGQTSSSYTPPLCTSNCPLYIATVTASNSAGTGYSLPITPVGPSLVSSAGIPVNTAAPTLPAAQPFAMLVSIISAGNGTWTNSPQAYTYQWSDSTSISCSSPTNIPGATLKDYSPQTNDVGLYLCVTVTAINSSGSASQISTTGLLINNSTAVPSAGASWPPTISGVAAVGSIVNIPSPSVVCNTFDSYFLQGVNFPVQANCSYQWYDWNGSVATPIPGATSYAYVVQTSDVGYELEVSAIGNNNSGTGTLAPTAPTATVTTPSSVPSNTALDTLATETGSSPCTTSASWYVGCTIKVNLGTWLNNPIVYTYQWYSGGVAIPGATSYSYTMQASDQGKQITLQVIAENNIGPSAVEITAATGTVVETGVPVGSTTPTITGKPVQGGLLTASTGTWTLSPTSYAYQWCSSSITNSGNCPTGTGPISGATNSTYIIPATYFGDTLAVAVLATNSAGSAASALTSAQTGAVTNPGGLVAGCTASISGTTQAGATLTASLSGCSGSPTSYTYAWTTGATTSTYVLAEGDVGGTVGVTITPTNSVGTSPAACGGSACTATSATITNPSAPSGGVVGSITNSPLVGQPASWSLTTAFSGVGTITDTYWICSQSSSSYSGSCGGTLVQWAGTNRPYVPTSSDLGNYIVYIVKGTNLGGTTQAYAVSSSSVTNPALSTNSIAPSIIGTAEVGNLLVSTIGTWTSTHTQFTFQWCSSGVAHTSACSTGYGPISGATKQSYALQSSDQTNTIEVGVTAINAAGSATAFSIATTAVAAFPYTSGACNGWASSTFYDGCAHAPPSGPYTVQHPTFFSGFTQRSGQGAYPSTYGCKGKSNCHPPWSVAGVDYPVGVSCGNSCGFGVPGSATDPTSASANISGVNPGDCALGTNTVSGWSASWAGGIATFTAPAGFSLGGTITTSGFSVAGFNGTFYNPSLPSSGNYIMANGNTFTVAMANPGGSSATGGTIKSYLNHLVCNVTASGGTVSFGPLDFSGGGNIGGQAISISLNGGGNACIIHDSLIYVDTNQTVVSGATSSDLVSGCTSLVLKNNTFMVRDTSGAQTPQMPAEWDDANSNTVYAWLSQNAASNLDAQVLNEPVIQEYNAWINCPARCTAYGGVISSRFNYAAGLNAYAINGSAAHGDGIFTSFYNGPIGYHGPCYCTGSNLISERFDTWSLAPETGTVGTAGAIDCGTCAIINVPEGVMNGWTTGDGIFHATQVSDDFGDFPAVNSLVTQSSTLQTVLVTQCKTFTGVVGCNEGQALSCSPAAPCEYTLNYNFPTCMSISEVPGQLCGFSYVYPATVDTVDVRNNVYTNNIVTANGSGGTGQVTGFPDGNGSSAIGLSYGNFNTVIVKNNYADLCGVKQGVASTWTAGFPSYQCVVPPTLTTSLGTVPTVWLPTGINANVFGAVTIMPTYNFTQADNVLMNNGGCLLAAGALSPVGYQPNPITDCATTASP